MKYVMYLDGRLAPISSLAGIVLGGLCSLVYSSMDMILGSPGSVLG